MASTAIGMGEYVYEVQKDWDKLPAGVEYGYTHGVAVDSQGRIIVHNQSKDSVIFFDPEGTFIKSWGPEFAEGAHGLQLSREDGREFLYLADIKRHIVVKTTLDGEVVWTLEYPKESGVYEDSAQYVPTNVAIAPNGDFYVADGYGQSYIHQYNAKAEYIRTWGGKGDAPGKMNCPHGIWIDTRGPEPLVLVADRANVRLQYFTLAGEHVKFVTNDLLHPCHFDERNGTLLIPDLHGRVTLFDEDNQLIAHLGETPGVNKREGYPNLPKEQWEPGKFISPHSACFDADGNIFIVEWIKVGRVTKLNKVG